MSLKIVIPSLLGILGSILLLLNAPKIANFIFPLDSELILPQAGSISSSFGGVEITHYNAQKPIRLPHRTEEPTPLRHQSLVKVFTGGELKYTTDSGYQLNFSEQSEFLLESKNTNSSNPSIYIYIFRGDFTTIQTGTMGSLFIVRDGIFSTPETPKAQAITPIQISESKDISLFFKPKPKTATSYSYSQSQEISSSVNKASSTTPGLSNEYLENMIAQQKKLFQKCQANSIRDQKPAHGQLLVAFTIEPDGSVSDTTVIKSDLSDESLKQCTMSVIKRIQFKKFSGPAFRASYPFSYQ